MDRDQAFRDVATGQVHGLRRLAYALCGDWHRADDLVQGCLERAYVKWASVAAADDQGAYLRTVLLRLHASEQRRSWRTREQLRYAVPDQAASHEDAEARLDLAAALGGLTAKQRAVVVLRYVEDRPVDEVASILGIAAGTVKRQSHDALAHLRQTLSEGDEPRLKGVPRG